MHDLARGMQVCCLILPNSRRVWTSIRMEGPAVLLGPRPTREPKQPDTYDVQNVVWHKNTISTNMQRNDGIREHLCMIVDLGRHQHNSLKTPLIPDISWPYT